MFALLALALLVLFVAVAHVKAHRDLAARIAAGDPTVAAVPHPCRRTATDIAWQYQRHMF